MERRPEAAEIRPQIWSGGLFRNFHAGANYRDVSLFWLVEMARRFKVTVFPTLATVVGIVMLLALGTWQADRYSQKTEIEELQAVRTTQPPLAIASSDQLIAPENQYRIADVHGSVDTARTVLFKFRIVDGKSGSWIASPLLLADGKVVLLLRGWVDVKDAEQLARSQKIPDSGIYRGLIHTLDANIEDEITRGKLPSDSVDSFVAWNTFDVEGVYDFWKLPHVNSRLVLIQTEGDPGPPVESADYITKPYMTADRHFGYALTWYTLSVCLLALWLAAGFGMISSPTRHSAPPKST